MRPQRINWCLKCAAGLAFAAWLPFIDGGTAEAQSRQRPRASNELQLPPGVMLLRDTPPEIIANIIEIHRDQLERREARQEELAREARVLKRRYDDDQAAADAPEILYRAAFQWMQSDAWQAAAESLELLVANHPDSIWSFEARICLHDLAYEISLDPEVAATWLNAELPAAIPFHEPPPVPEDSIVVPASGLSFDEELPLEVPGPEHRWTVEGTIVPRSSDEVLADIQLRLGLNCYWKGDESGADSWLEQARRNDQFQGPFTDAAKAVSPIADGARYPYPPMEVLTGDAQSAQLLQYAIALLEGEKGYRAHRMLDAMVSRDRPEVTSEQQGFLLYRRAFARYRMANPYERDPELILEDYERAVELVPDAPWADHALYLAANAVWNLARDYEHAVTIWRRVFDEYPASGLAAMSALSIATYYEQQERWIEAYDMFWEAIDRDPENAMADQFAEHIDDMIRHIPEEHRREPREPTRAENE